MTKVKMNIAGGYMRGEIQNRIAESPNQSHTEVITRWLDDRYGAWVRANMETTAFVFADIHVEGEGENMKGSFVIDFENPNHEDYFVRHVGGKIVPSEDV